MNKIDMNDSITFSHQYEGESPGVASFNDG